MEMRDSKGRFVKGHKGIKNKGRTGMGSNKTSFKKGTIIGKDYWIKKGEHRGPKTEFKKGKHVKPKNEFKKGHKQVCTKEMREKISIANKGKKRTEETKRKLSKIHLGKKQSKETIEKRFKNIRGENHWNWKGGISGKGYPDEWNNSLKRLVFIRDNFKCFLCQSKKQIIVHHIDENKENCEENNLITLCRSCHIKLHKKLDKKIFIVTGNSKGIGLAVSNSLRKENYYVPIISKENNFNLMENGLKRLIHLIDYFPISGIINNVGGCGTCSYKDWRIAMEKNYGITNQLTMRYLMKKKKWGRVITISSIFGKEKGHNPGFTAAKAAQIAFMKSLAGKYENITFNCISPGFINTNRGMGKEAGKYGAPLGKSEDVASIVTFLCSERASFINGACIVVDGGFSRSF